MKKILLIHTGGTMGMALNGPETSNQFVDEIFAHVPGVRDIVDIDSRTAFRIDSSNCSIDHWLRLGELIEAQMESHDGFVIIHGTDTMSYTASALSFMLQNLPRPVILTGSQRPLSAIRTDAKNNLINAIELATYHLPEVCIFFDYKLFRGNRTKKISIDEYDAFASPNFPTLAEVGLNIEIKNNHRWPDGPFRLESAFDNRVVCLRLFPGLDPKLIEPLIHSDARVFILEAFGAGNVPALTLSFIPFIRKITEAGKLAAITSQSMRGAVNLQLYDGGRQALEAGAISCGDMTTEAAVIKAMFLLGRFRGSVSEVRSAFAWPLAGEVAEP